MPADNLIGAENAGFKCIMHNFNNERLMLAAQAVGLARACHAEALQWAQHRTTFGRPLVSRQAVRHMLVDMATQLEAADALLHRVADGVAADGPNSAQLAGEICMVKNFATGMVEYVATRAVQLLGGAGYMCGSVSERVFR